MPPINIIVVQTILLPKERQNVEALGQAERLLSKTLAPIEEQLKNKKAEADDIGSRVIPELLAEQGLSEIKLADGSKVSVKKEFVELFKDGIHLHLEHIGKLLLFC